MGSIEAAKKV